MLMHFVVEEGASISQELCEQLAHQGVSQIPLQQPMVLPEETMTTLPQDQKGHSL